MLEIAGRLPSDKEVHQGRRQREPTLVLQPEPLPVRVQLEEYVSPVRSQDQVDSGEMQAELLIERQTGAPYLWRGRRYR